jgi:hypothetical protein
MDGQIRGEPMITRADVDKLLSMSTAEPSLLSLYLGVPRDPAQLRELPARADDLLVQPARAPQRERETVRRLLAAHARDWLGHTVAIFASAQLGLAEVIPLPGALPERAVLAVRPHVRPLLLAIQRYAPTALSWPTSGIHGCCGWLASRSAWKFCVTRRAYAAAASAAGTA